MKVPRRIRKQDYLVGYLLICLFSAVTWGAEKPPPEKSMVSEARSAVKEGSPPPEAPGSREAYREAVLQIAEFLRYGGLALILAYAIVVYVLVYTPKEIRKAKPFDPNTERKRHKGDVSSSLRDGQ